MTVHNVRVRVQELLGPGVEIRGFLGYIHWAVEQIRNRGQWSFDFKAGKITTVASYSDGTVDVSNGDATITGNDTVFTSAMDGRKIRIAGVEYVFESRTNDTEAELDETYKGDDASALSFVIFQPEYSLESDVVSIKRLWDMTQQQWVLWAESQIELRTRDIASNAQGSPRFYTEVGVDSSNNRKIMLFPFPTSIERYEYWYESAPTKVTSVSSSVDFPPFLDETLVQGVYARILNTQVIHPAIRRGEATAVLASERKSDAQLAGFQQMIEKKWQDDQPLKDTFIAMERMDQPRGHHGHHGTGIGGFFYSAYSRQRLINP